MNRLILHFLFPLFILLFLSCEMIGTPEKVEGVALKKGQALFVSLLGQMHSPRGILPDSMAATAATYPGIITHTDADYYEFFVFDDNHVLAVLSISPFFFVHIQSREFYSHCNDELVQISSGTEGKDKRVNSMTWFRDVGEYSVEIYFTPKELYYTSSGGNAGKLKDPNDITYVDLWKLMEADTESRAYIPVYEEETIHQMAADSIAAGYDEHVWYNSTTIASPQNCSVVPQNLNFAFIHGRNLRLTDDLLGYDSVHFIDKEERTRDYIAFFSVPLGNYSDDTKDYLTSSSSDTDARDGIVIIIRGHDLGRLMEPLRDEGFEL